MDPTIPTSSSSQASFSPYQLSIDLGEEDKYSRKVQCVVDSLPHNPVLHSLDLSARKPKIGSSRYLSSTHLQLVADALLTNTALKILKLNGNRLPENEHFVLGPALRMNSTLTALHLDHCLDEEDFDALAEDVISNPTLTALSLRGCYIGGKSFDDITAALQNHTLRELNLGYLVRQKPFNEMAKLADALKINSTLTELDISQNAFLSGDSTLLAQVLAANSTLTTLTMTQTCHAKQDVNAILLALLTNSHLTTINLKFSATPPSSTLESVLNTNTTLTSLNLSHCGLGSEGTLVIGKALTGNTTLLDLNLSGNSIGPDGFCGLAGSLLTNSTLTNLNLAGNPFDSSGAKMMTEVFQRNTTLTALSFGKLQASPELTQDEWTGFFKALGENSSLKTLELQGRINSDEVPLLSSVIQINTVLEALRLNRAGITRFQHDKIAQVFATNGSLTDFPILHMRLSFFEDFEERNRHNQWQKEISLFTLIRDTFTEALYAQEIAAVSTMHAQASSSKS